MKNRFIVFVLSAILVLTTFAGCSKLKQDNIVTGSGTTASESSSVKDTSEPTDDYVLKVGTLKGPTGMGMAKLISDNKGTGKYEINICSAPDEITSALISNQLDVAAVPVNLAAVINKKTEGKYKIAAVNTLGVLYILENGNTVNSISDLAGKTLYATGQAATPEYILNYILEKNGLDNVTVEYKTEHSELATLLASGDVMLGMLPEPNVTTALSKNSSLRIALDLSEEWKKVSDGEAIQGCLVVSEKAISEHKSLLDGFLDEYKQSVGYVNDNITEASEMIAESGIVGSAALAAKAIPNCNIVYIDGDEMKSVLNGFFKVLFDASPSSVGGTLPGENIYYTR